MLDVISTVFLGSIAVFTGVIAVFLVLAVYVSLQVLSKPAPPPQGGLPLWLLPKEGHPGAAHGEAPGAEKSEGKVDEAQHGQYL